MPGASAIILAALAGAPVQAADNAQTADPGSGQEIIVVGQRGSVVTDVDPLASLDSNAIVATGATTMAELLRAIRGTTQVADGSEPIFLLNGQRVSGYQEIGTLPPEAIDKVEVMPEPVALRYGFPPTRRVVNFITKPRFRQMETRGTVGNATEGDTPRGTANLGLTRLRNDGRLTLALEYRHTDSLFFDERDIAPDPDILLDAIGNVSAPGGGEIDPVLSALAGQPVTVVPVPEAPGDRATLAGFATGANRPRLYDLGRNRTLLPLNDAVKADMVLADRISETVAGSLTLSAETSRDRTISSPAPATFLVSSSNPYSPFAGPVVLQRYLTEVDPLRQRQTITTINAGGTLRGAVAGWRWDFTAALNQKRTSGFIERGIDLTAANAAIGSGANPFVPLDPALLADRLVDHARLRTRSANLKTVITNTPIDLPAGAVSVTGTAEFERLGASASTRGANPYALDLARSRTEAGIALDLPIASAKAGVLPFLGELSFNAAANIRRVGGFGALSDTSFGAAWSVSEGVQLLAQVKRSAAAPGLEALATPVVRIADAPVFDFRYGRTELATIIQGGNPDLLAEHRRVRSLTLNVRPFSKRELRVGLTYETTDIRDQTGTVYAFTPQVEALLPDLVERDVSGRLVSVTFQPINFYRQRQRTLNLTFNANGTIGKPPSGEPDPAKPPPPRVNYYGGMGPTIKLSDRLQLRPGTPEFDILAGDTIVGWGSARAFGYAYGGLNYRGHGANFDFWYGGPSRVRGDNPATDLRFSSIFKLNVGAYASLHQLFPKLEWTKGMQLRFDVNNVTNDRQSVIDANGEVPNRFQPYYLDAVGRTLSVSLRKRF